MTENTADTIQEDIPIPNTGNAESAENVESTESETFTREYVERLRKENAEHRIRSKRADDLARQLLHSRVAATGKLADPADLEFAEDLLDDMPGLEAAIEDLLARKPHLASRTPRGDAGQGFTGGADTVDLAAILRAGAN